jgi:glycosyltransferase involved in cell wall biosynthesis
MSSLQHITVPSTPAPAVSVIVLCHNYAAYLRTAVASVLAQTYTNYEVIIIDDGSTDDSLKIAQKLADEHGGAAPIRVFHLDDVGSSAARRFGVEHARGRYYAPLDADDKLAPAFLEKTVPVLEADARLGFAYTDSIYFGDKNQRIIHPEYDFGLLCATSRDATGLALNASAERGKSDQGTARAESGQSASAVLSRARAGSRWVCSRCRGDLEGVDCSASRGQAGT